MSDKILNTLLAAGFLPNYDKSIFTPVQSIDWLGFYMEFKRRCIRSPFKENDQNA
jgi:putative methionine-R-sulfoxide reductase with GAF domain